MSESPVELLKNIAAKCNDAEQQKISGHESWAGIGFSLCGQKMLAPINEISEIIHMPKLTFLPGVKDSVRGVANLRGKLVPIVDLEGCFDSKLLSNKTKHRILVVEYSGSYVGLIVSMVFGLKYLDEDSFVANKEVDTHYSNFIESEVLIQNQKWKHFNLIKFINSHQFDVIANNKSDSAA